MFIYITSFLKDRSKENENNNNDNNNKFVTMLLHSYKFYTRTGVPESVAKRDYPLSMC